MKMNCVSMLLMILCHEIAGVPSVTKKIPFMREQKGDFLMNCLKHRNDENWMEDIRGSHKINCLRFLESIRNSTKLRRNDSIQSTENDRSCSSIFSYLSALSNWRNREVSLEKSLLDFVSPCYVVSRKISRSWRRFFKKRHNTASVVPMAYSKFWQGSNGSILIRPSRIRERPENLIAAELVLARSRPSDIGEAFGTYRISATLMADHTHQAVLHSAVQFLGDPLTTYQVMPTTQLDSCGISLVSFSLCFGFKWCNSRPTCSFGDGRFFVLDLTTAHLANWHRLKNENLSINVEVKPRRQYFYDLKKRNINVVSEIAGIVLHFRRSSRRERLKEPNSNTRNFDWRLGPQNADQNLHPRNRRSLLQFSARRNRNSEQPRSNKPCHLTPFVLSRNTTRMFHVSWPERGRDYWDISECSGDCHAPVPSHVDITNHAILQNYETVSKICCVPVEFHAQHYITEIEGELRLKSFKDMIATKCGCR